MEEEWAPSLELEDGENAQGRMMGGVGGFGCGHHGHLVPGDGYGTTNPYPPQYPTPYHAPPHGGGGSGLYPNIGFIDPGIRFPGPPPPYGSPTFLECPICRQRLMGRIYQCQNKHVICHRCIDLYEFCTVCNVSLVGPRIRNLELERIVEGHGQEHEVVEVSCPNSLEGCEVVTSPDLLGNHLEVCDFRSLPFCSKLLGWTHCDAMVNSSTILDHLREAHQVVEMNQSKFTLKLILPNNVLYGVSPGAIWDPVLVTSSLDMNAMIKLAVSPQGLLLITGFLLGGSPSEARNYRVKYELNSKSKMSRLEWTGSLLSYRHLNHSELLPNVNTFRIPIDSLRQYAKSHSSEDSYEEDLKLKIKACLWNVSEDHPFKECFRNVETGEKESLEKTTLISSLPSEGHTFSDTFLYDSRSIPDTFPSDTVCHHCSRPIYGVIYQCLQCPQTSYFCRHCIEIGNVHNEHLTIRISNPEQIPLASVAYECSAGELA